MGFLDSIFKRKSEAKKEENVDEMLIECVKELVMIYSRNPGGFLMDSPSAEPVKAIGRKLNEAGGKDRHQTTSHKGKRSLIFYLYGRYLSSFEDNDIIKVIAI